MNTSEIKWKLFPSWLKQQKDTDIIELGSCKNCLLFKFLTDTHGINTHHSGFQMLFSEFTFDYFIYHEIPKEIASIISSLYHESPLPGTKNSPTSISRIKSAFKNLLEEKDNRLSQ